MFLTKKKLSSFSGTHWTLVLITSIVLGFLFTIVEIVKINNKKVIFFNVRTVNTENRKDFFIEKGSKIDNNFPVFIFFKENVLFGTLRSLIAPLPQNDVLLLKKSWQKDFTKKIPTYNNKKNIFPAKTFGIVFEQELTYEDTIEIMRESSDLIAKQNIAYKSHLKNDSYPSIIILNTQNLN
jgi:hypothetical protein